MVFGFWVVVIALVSVLFIYLPWPIALLIVAGATLWVAGQRSHPRA